MSATDSALLKFFESVADFGTWLVIIGVAGEGIEILLKVLQHKLPNKKFLAWCKKNGFCIEIWGALFWLMVVVGLAIEFRYGHKAKTITDKENVRLTQNAADLNLKAESFRLKAANLEQQIEDAKNNITQIDWRNKSIYAFSAKAVILVRPLEPVENLENLPKNLADQLFDSMLRLPKVGNGQRIELTLGDAKELSNGPTGHGALVFSDNVSESLVTNWDGKAAALRYDIFFDDHSDKFFEGNFKPSEISAIELILPLRCEVLFGKIEMAIDGGLTNRAFDIHPQKSLVHMISSFETNGQFAPLNLSPNALDDAAVEGAFSKVETNVDFLNPPK